MRAVRHRAVLPGRCDPRDLHPFHPGGGCRHSFAERFYRQHAASTLFLRAERQPGGRRNFKLAVKEPLPTSFGEDLYYRLGGWLDEDKAVTPAAARAAPDGELDGGSRMRQAGQIAAVAPDAPGAG